MNLSPEAGEVRVRQQGSLDIMESTALWVTVVQEAATLASPGNLL